MAENTNPLQSAGKVDIQELTLISGNGTYISLLSYMIELNLYEDIYSSGLYGNIVLSDSIGLVHRLSLMGEEYLTIKIDTPSFKCPIYKSFRCCSINDRVFTRDTTTESYVIHFVSPEVYLDHYIPVQRAFEGKAEDIVGEIYQKYLNHPRTMQIKDSVITNSDDYTELSLFTSCAKPVKFISPSWSPMKCISWLSSKVKPTEQGLDAPNYMFFESNRRFYWATLEDIVRKQRDNQTIAGIYYYIPGNVKIPLANEVTVDNRIYKGPDLTRDFFTINDLTVLNNVDGLQNLQNGYLTSVYHELDITKRKYTEQIYDHVERYPFYQHTSTDASGFFASDVIRTPYSHQIVGFKHEKLFTDIKDNLNESAKDIMPARTSLMNELNQIKMKINIPGRTDIEIGCLIYLTYPKSGPRGENDKNQSNIDSHYSGLYIMTAIHHKITLENHFMTAEIVKDSYGDVNEGKAAE